MVGYSGTPLPRKLGLTEGCRVAVLDAPPGFDDLLEPLPDDVQFLSLRAANLDLILFFVTREVRLRARLAKAAARLRPAGGLWVAWPKRASGAETDLTEDTVRDVAQPLGLVDNKVAAIDETWSGLRLVVRKVHRDTWPARLDG